MTYKTMTFGLFVIAATFVVLWISIIAFRPQYPIQPKKSGEPDAFMEDVVALVLDKEGKPKMKIVTPKMTHFIEDDLTLLLSPKLTIYRDSPRPWYVTSRFAKAYNGAEKIDFHHDVLIHHPADVSSPQTFVRTALLTVYPNKQIAETNVFVELKEPNLLVTAVGMHADMNTGEIKLLSKTRGVYVPETL